MSPSAPPAVKLSAFPLTVPAVRRMSPAVAASVALPVVVMLPPIVQVPVVLVRSIAPLPVVPLTVAPLLSVMNTSPVPAPVKLIVVPVVSIAAPLAPMSPSAPAAMKVSRLPLTVPAVRRMSPAATLSVTLPVVEMFPPMVSVPPEVTTTLPLPVVPERVAPSSSPISTTPVPAPVKTIVVPAVSSGVAGRPMSPSAPPAVSVRRAPLMRKPGFGARSPAVAVMVTLPVVVTLPPNDQSPVLVRSVMFPEPVEPLTLAPLASVMNTSPVPAPANEIVPALVSIGEPDVPMSPSTPLTAAARRSTVPVVEINPPESRSPFCDSRRIVPLPVEPLSVTSS